MHYFDKKNCNNTITIIPFREPYKQAQSLLNQHLLLSKLQSKDEFVLDYMDFLVHHEFGLHTKIPKLSIEEFNAISHSKQIIDYWLEIWYLYYSEVYKQFLNKENFYFFSYENFKNEPKSSLQSIISILDLPEMLIESIVITEYKAKDNDKSKIDTDKYLKLYKKLNLISVNKDYG